MMPKDLSFFDYFDQHATLIVAAARELSALVATATEAEGRARRIKELEHEADSITHRCVETLHRTFITPFDSDHIHRLITRMDDVMDSIEAAAERICLYRLTEMTPEVRDMCDVLERAGAGVQALCQGLRKLKEPEVILRTCVDINRLENEADAILRRAVARLFDQETNPVTIIKWKEVYEHLESAADNCEDVADIVEGVVLEHA
jgi:predicted phosphate transport protein (TIGR00153 family)